MLENNFGPDHPDGIYYLLFIEYVYKQLLYMKYFKVYLIKSITMDMDF